MSEAPYSSSIFLIDADKVQPNPFQPRKEFDEKALASLADSIRQYGVLQPLVVTRIEVEKPGGGIAVEYELIAGERRLRASKLAGLHQVPALIRTGEHLDKMKLELAIIENLQREDLNPVDRAEAFKKLIEAFAYKHTEVAKKIGKSREYVSNTLRILMLPSEIIESLRTGEITEGHTRPLLMLIDRKDEQAALHKDIMLRRLSVRESEKLARRIAVERVRKWETMADPDIMEAEEELAMKLGTKVLIERKGTEGGKIVIDFFTNEDLRGILEKVVAAKAGEIVTKNNPEVSSDDRSKEEKREDEDQSELYSVSNFTI